MRLLIIASILFSSASFAKTANVHQMPSQILPLDEEAKRILKAGPLTNEVVEDDANQKEFHAKIYKASQLISPLINLKDGELFLYVYDCLFIVEEGFFLKYSHLPKDKLVATRKMVTESFRK